MSRLLCIADVHLRHRHIDTILSWEEPYDTLVATGDYFDQWSDTPAQNADAARWLKGKLEDPRSVMLLGNHDISYMFSHNSHAQCSGFTREKCRAIRKELTQLDFLKLRPCHVAHGILFSHAGFSRDLIEMLTGHGYTVPTELTAESIAKWTNDLWPSIMERYSVGQGHPLLMAGYDRGGSQNVGGIIWGDVSRHFPIENLRQIFGHSICADGPVFKLLRGDGDDTFYRHARDFSKGDSLGGWSLDIDTNSKHYVVIEDSVLHVKSVNWQRKTGEDDFTVTPGATICEIDLAKITA